MKFKNFLKKNALNIARIILVIALTAIIIAAVSCSDTKNAEKPHDGEWIYYSVEISDYSHENYRHGSITSGNAEKIEFVSVEEHNFETVKLDEKEIKFCLDCGWHANETCEDYHDFRIIRELEDDRYTETQFLYVCADCGCPSRGVKHSDEGCNFIDDNGEFLSFNVLTGGFVDDEGYKRICEVCEKTAITHKHENIGNAYLGNTEMYAKAEDVPACGDWCKDCYYVFENEGHKYELHISWGRVEKQIGVGGTLIDYDNKNNICYYLKCPHCEAEVLLDVAYSDNPLSETEVGALAEKYSAVIVDERT